MISPNTKCEVCSMDATHEETDNAGRVHYFCEHHGLKDLSTSAEKKTVKDFLPLIVIFAVILLFTVIRQLRLGYFDELSVMFDFEAAFFIIFGLFKLLNWRGFVDAYQTYDIIAERNRLYAWMYPLIEIGLGLGFLFRWNPIVIAWATLIIMVISSVGVFRALRRKNQIMCACLGVVFKIPMTYVTFVEDVVMAVMAAMMLVVLR